jgi:N-acetylneuraminate synthase
MRYDTSLLINGREVASDRPSYFIADVGSNHEGDLGRAKALIWQVAEAGGDAVKFQHFLAKDIVSDFGFKSLGGQVSHQANWKKSVFEIYQQYEFNRSWNEVLAEEAREAKIHFMTSPYDHAAIAQTLPLVDAFKIGSGDITWTQIMEAIAAAGKPVLLATGASDQEDVDRAVATLLKHTSQLCLMQCNTNYTGSLENFRYVNLNVLKSFALRYPGMVLGLSDHTPGHAAVLGAVAFGARIIEKHFTDDNSRTGPDHAFALNPATWRDMVDRTRELELALGDGVKRVEDNERDTIVVQRRCLRLKQDLPAGSVVSADHLEALRPAPAGAFAPWQMGKLLGRKLVFAKVRGDAIYAADLETDHA